MSALGLQRLPAGHALFARYAFPPNELGYCGPADAAVLLRGDSASEVAAHAREFDGAWPYLRAIADAAGLDDPLDAEVVHSYWVGGPMLDCVEPGALLDRLRDAFKGQLTGVLGELTTAAGVLANHCFHVFAVYPWVRFLDRDPTTPVKVMQDCRIRWGVVDTVGDDQVSVVSQPLVYHDGVLGLGEPVAEDIQWQKDGVSLIAAPAPGDTVSAHWDWVCGRLSPGERDALAAATATTLDLVNGARAPQRSGTD